MPSTLKRDFHRAAFHEINTFFKYISALSENPVIAGIQRNLPEDVTLGRTFAQMAMDDLMDDYAQIMRNVADDKIPAGMFKQMLNLRFDRDYSENDARDIMLEKIRECRQIPQNESQRIQNFFMCLIESGPEEDIKNIVGKYLGILNQMRQLTLDDDSFAAMASGTFVINHFKMAADFLVKTVDENSKRYQSAKGAVSQFNSDGEDYDDDDLDQDPLDDLIDRVNKAGMPDHAFAAAKKELRDLQMMNPQSSEYPSVFNYVDLLASLPWKAPEKTKVDLAKARETLDRDHYGLRKVKERILQYLAVQNQIGKTGPTILCIDGPPGTGKTSITKSIAEATGRKFIRIALGGIHDEATIRGFERTYTKSAAGRIIKSMKDAGVPNPVINLDEIEKVGQGQTKGDIASALLEVLDPEQNKTFHDHYLGVDYDLSNVMFIATSNYLDQIPPALRDRMDIIRIGSYTREEKLEIARRHLVPKQLALNGLKPKDLRIDDASLKIIIKDYIREPGVRELERKIATACRAAVVKLQEGTAKKIAITPKNLESFIGKNYAHHETIPAEDMVGQVNGLAYTGNGGCILPIQVVTNPSSSFRITNTGLLRESMRESTIYAPEMIKSLALRLGLDRAKLEKTHFHIHAPAAATPKDGPSAGAAIATVIVSAFTGIAVRRDVAMTGEVDVFGNVLPIGGLSEKLQGAIDAGVKTVLIPKANIGDLSEIPESVLSALEIIPVTRIEDVLDRALTQKLPGPDTSNVVSITSGIADCACPPEKKRAAKGPAPT
jgi:ATP-dependent Lon protease